MCLTPTKLYTFLAKASLPIGNIGYGFHLLLRPAANSLLCKFDSNRAEGTVGKLSGSASELSKVPQSTVLAHSTPLTAGRFLPQATRRLRVCPILERAVCHHLALADCPQASMIATLYGPVAFCNTGLI